MKADVAVVGGGVIGLAVAWRAAQRGLSVVLVDDARRARGSWAAAGMLAPVAEVGHGEERLLALSLRSAQMYPSFVAELESATGIDAGYRSCGALLVAVDGDDHAQLLELAAFHERLGLASRRVDRRGARELEPALHPSIRSPLVIDGDHQVDNRRLLRVACCRGRGGGADRDRYGQRGDGRAAVVLADHLTSPRAHIATEPAFRTGMIVCWAVGFIAYQWIIPTGPTWWTTWVYDHVAQAGRLRATR